MADVMKRRVTMPDIYELGDHMKYPGPYAFTTEELDALWSWIGGFERHGELVPYILGCRVVEVPRWPEWLT